MVICAFPTTGKTYLTCKNPGKYYDFDLGVPCSCCNTDEDRCRHFKNLYNIRGFRPVFLINSPAFAQLLVKHRIVPKSDIVFVLPSYDTQEAVKRCVERFGYDAFCKELETHFKDYVNDWRCVANETSANPVVWCNSYLSDCVDQTSLGALVRTAWRQNALLRRD